MDKKFTIADYMNMDNYNDIDCYDDTFDIDGVAVCWDGEEAKDDYDRTVEYITKHTFVEHLNRAVYKYDSDSLIVDFVGFVKDNIKAFEQYTHEKNNPDYDMTEYDDEDDKMEVAIRTINNLLAGNYSMSDYARFMELVNLQVNV